MTKKRVLIGLLLFGAGVAVAQPVVIAGIVLRLERLALLSFPAAAEPNAGGLLYDGDAGVVDYSDGTRWAPVGYVRISNDIIPFPEGATTGNATRIAQTVFDGASYRLEKPTFLASIVFRVTGVAGAPTGRFLIYQAPFGGSGTANLVASAATVAIGASGNFAVTPAEGTVLLAPGRIFFLYGRDSAAGSFTMRTRTTQALDLFTANLDTATHPTTFTTAIAATTSPATFDPREAPTGQATGSSSDLCVALRFR